VNLVITAKPAQLPIYQDRPVTRPVVSVAGSAGEFRDASKQAPSTYVYRGELLEAVANNQHYRPQLNQQIDPENRRAIDSYRSVAATPTLVGQILDGFI
jgi:hypothetical protein